MPIGSNISVDLPIPGDTYADITAKLKAAIEVLVELLEAPIDSGALDLTTALSLHGAPLINVGGLRLVGGESTEIGTFYIDGAGEVHAVTSLGDVQITLNGNLNVAALGTIGGDYGGANPATVTFDDASGEYRFKEDTAVWASVVAAEFIAKNPSTGSIAFGVDPAITTAKTFTIKSLPASGVSGLAYVAADGTVVDANATRETLTHKFTSIDLTANAYHGDITFTVPFGMSQLAGTDALLSQTVAFGTDGLATILPTGQTCRKDIPVPLLVGRRLKSIAINGSSGHAVSVVLRSQNYDDATSPAHSTTGQFNTTGQYKMTLNTPHTITAGDTFYMVMSPGASDVSLVSIEITYDFPAP